MDTVATMSELDVRARVTAFVADFHRAWQVAGRPPDRSSGERPDFDAWRTALDEVAAAHCTDGTRTGAEGSMGSHPDHSPDETVTAVAVDDAAGTATVDTVLDGVVASYYRYPLVRLGDRWLITAVEHYFDPPGAPLVTPEEAARLLALATYDAPLGAAAVEPRADPGRLFEPHRDVRALGTVTTSGTLAVRDMGYGDYALEPLARRVPPGTYPAETVRHQDRTAAVRLVLSTAPVVTWHEAGVVGVDAGNVGIVDLAGLLACDAQEAERHFATWALTAEDATLVLRPGGPTDAVLVTSGYGDGGYPVWWGVGADGAPAVLLVDFVVLPEAEVRDPRQVTVPWRTGTLLDDPEVHVASSGPSLRLGLGRRRHTLRHREGAVSSWRVVGPDGADLVHSDRLGNRHADGLVTYEWTGPVPATGSLLVLTG